MVGESLDEIRAKGTAQGRRLRGLRALLRGARRQARRHRLRHRPPPRREAGAAARAELGPGRRDGRGRPAQPCLARWPRRSLGREPDAARALQPRARDPQRARGAGAALLHGELRRRLRPLSAGGRSVAGRAGRQHDRGRARQPAGLLSRLDAGRPAAGGPRPLPPAGGRPGRAARGRDHGLHGPAQPGRGRAGQRAGAVRSRLDPAAGAHGGVLGRGRGRARERARSRLCGRRHPGWRGARRHDGRRSSPSMASATTRRRSRDGRQRPLRLSSTLPEPCSSDFLTTTSTGRALMAASRLLAGYVLALLATARLRRWRSPTRTC